VLFNNPEEKAFEKKHSDRTKVKYIERVFLGHHPPTPTWYYSPYPEEYEKV